MSSEEYWFLRESLDHEVVVNEKWQEKFIQDKKQRMMKYKLPH